MKHFLLLLVRRFMHGVYSAYGTLLLGRRVSAHGFFRVQVPENVQVGNDCSFNEGVLIVGRRRIVIGDRVTLSARVMLIDAGLVVGDENRGHTAADIVVGNDVWIGAGAIVLPGVRIGDHAVVGAGSVVTRDIPALVVAVGNPARVVRDIRRT